MADGRAELRSADLALLLDVVRELSGLDGLAELRRVVPEMMLRLVPGVRAGYNEVDMRTGETYVVYAPADPDADAVVDRFSEYALEHPTAQHMVRTGDGRATAISDLMSRDRFLASRLYRELFVEIATEDQLTIGLPSPRPLSIGIPVNRDSWGFTVREHALLDELRPHLVQAHASAGLREALRRAVTSRDRALTELHTGVVRLGGGGHVVDASPAAARWLRQGLLEGARASDELLEWYHRQRSRLRAAEGAPALATSLVVDGAEGRVSVRYLGDDLLLVRAARRAAEPEDLRRFGLTEAEAGALALMVAGHSTAEAAAELFVTADTVRRHLSRAYRKLGVRTRGAAVAYVTAVLEDDGG